MIKIKKRIEIISSENKSLSSMSAASRRAIYVALKKHYTDVVITIVNDLSDLEEVAVRNPDLIFLGMKCVPTNAGNSKVWLADFFDRAGIAYTGSGSSAHALELNKNQAKQRILDVGLQTSPFYLFESSISPASMNNPLSYPLFVKPNAGGGGTGIDENSIVHNKSQLDYKLRQITETTGSDSLVEQYLTGREFSVAILQDEQSGEYLTMPVELIAPANSRGDRILSQEVKDADTESFIKVTDSALSKSVCELALRAFNALGARDYGRIDIRMNAEGEPSFLEANLIPSLLEGYGNFPKACLLNEGLSYQQIILSIVNLGLSRSEKVVTERSLQLLPANIAQLPILVS